MWSGRGQGGYDPPSGKAPFHVREISQFRQGSLMGTIKNVIADNHQSSYECLGFALKEGRFFNKNQAFPVSLNKNPKFLFFAIETPTSCCPLRVAWDL